MRVYIAGAYSADNVLTVLNNMRKGMRLSTEAFLKGFSVFSPWLDYNFVLQLRGKEKLTVQQFYDYSIDWLKVSQAVLVVPGYEKSVGTLNELKIAKELKIPVYFSLKELIQKEKNKKLACVKVSVEQLNHGRYNLLLRAVQKFQSENNLSALDFRKVEFKEENGWLKITSR